MILCMSVGELNEVSYDERLDAPNAARDRSKMVRIEDRGLVLGVEWLHSLWIAAGHS